LYGNNAGFKYYCLETTQKRPLFWPKRFLLGPGRGEGQEKKGGEGQRKKKKCRQGASQWRCNHYCLEATQKALFFGPKCLLQNKQSKQTEGTRREGGARKKEGKGRGEMRQTQPEQAVTNACARWLCARCWLRWLRARAGC